MSDVTALRDAFGEALLRLGKRRDDFVVLDADNAPATRLKAFAEAFPHRFVNVGCAEQNLVGVAAGIASTGRTAVAATFSVFLCGRAFEQIRNTVAMNALPVVLLGTHAGVTVGKDGASHFSLDDISLMRAVPEMAVLVGSRVNQAESMMATAIERRGPVYVRVSRHISDIDHPDTSCALGGSLRLRTGNDISIFAAGIPVIAALSAASQLSLEGIQADVLDLYSVEPLDEGSVLESLRRTSGAIVVEEHGPRGGLGEAVMSVAGTNHPTTFRHLAVRQTFGRSGAPDALLALYGLTAADIVEAAHQLLEGRD